MSGYEMTSLERTSSSRITVYEPDVRYRIGILASYLIMFRNTLRAKDLIWQLFKRDLFAAHKKSFLGYAWIILSPLMAVVSWILMHAAGILTPGQTGIPYPAYVLLGSTIWGLFMSSYTAAAGTLTAGTGLILQVNYPHEVLLIKQLAQSLTTFSIGFCFALLAIAIFGIHPTLGIFLFPIVVIPTILLGSAIGLVVSMISVITMDVGNSVGIGLGFVIYLVPVLYGDNISNHLLAKVVRLNPLTYLICSARDIVFLGKLYDPHGFAIAAGLSILAFLFSLRIFFVLEQRLVERIIG